MDISMAHDPQPDLGHNAPYKKEKEKKKRAEKCLIK